MPNSDGFNLENPQIVAEGLPPEEAIRFWRDRANLTWDEAKELSEAARARAFYVTGLMQKDLVDKVSDALREALENGETLEEFKKRIPEIIRKLGWKDYRIETIFRTNMQTAYSAGRYAKMTAVKKTRPYWQYLAIMDKRTRPSHAVLHEKIYPADHEFWDSNYPPNGFRCRCAVRTLSERQVGSEGLTVEKEMPKPQFWTDPATNQQHYVQFPGAEKGFRNNPAKEWLEGKEIKGTASHLSGDPFFERFKNIVIDVFKINPDYYINAECRRNCQRCVLAYERRRRGDNVEAMPNPYPDRSGTSLRKSINGSEAFKNAEIHGINHKGGKAIGKEELKAILKKKNELPDGARAAIFWVKPDRESSHIIVCEKIGERVVFIDPQSGARGDAALRKCYAPNGYSWYRIDNLELNEDFEWNEVIKDARL